MGKAAPLRGTFILTERENKLCLVSKCPCADWPKHLVLCECKFATSSCFLGWRQERGWPFSSDNRLTFYSPSVQIKALHFPFCCSTCEPVFVATFLCFQCWLVQRVARNLATMDFSEPAAYRGHHRMCIVFIILVQCRSPWWLQPGHSNIEL